MKQGYTHLVFIIDRSGSMGRVWSDVRGAYAQTIKDQAKLAGEATITTVAFDTEYDVVEDFTDIKKARPELTVAPRGGTALLDAIGRAVSEVGEKLAKLAENDRPERVLVTVQTDGQENSSREYNRAQIKDIIERQKNEYKWEFLFVGADINAVQDAQKYGFSAANTSVYDVNNTGATFGVLNSKMMSYRCAVSQEAATADLAFTEEDRKTLLDKKV